MKKSKLYYYLSKFSKSELREFKNFCRSPFHAQGENLPRVLEIFEKKILKTPEDLIPERKAFFQTLYPEGSEGYTKKILSNLQGLLEQYLALKHLKKHKDYLSYAFLAEVVDRNWTKFFPSGLEKTKRALKAKPVAPDHYQRLFDLEQLQIKYRLYNRNKKDLHHSVFQTALKLLAHNYITQSLRFSSAAINGDLTFGNRHQLGKIDHTMEALSMDRDTLPNPAKLYYLAYQSLAFPEDKKNIGTLIELLKEKGGKLKKEEALDIFNICMNYIVRKINAGEHQFLDVAQSLYHYGLTSQILLSDKGKIHPTYFLNIVTFMTKNGILEWTQTFIEDWESQIDLKPEESARLVQYCKGVLSFIQGDFQTSKSILMELFRKFDDLGDVFLELKVEVHLCAASFELKDWQHAFELGKTFQRSLRRDTRLPQFRKKGHLNYFRFLTRLINIITGDPNRIQKKLHTMELQMAQTGPFLLKDWLWEKMDLFKNK